MFVPVNVTLCMSITTCVRMSMGAYLNMSLCVEVNGLFIWMSECVTMGMNISIFMYVR